MTLSSLPQGAAVPSSAVIPLSPPPSRPCWISVQEHVSPATIPYLGGFHPIISLLPNDANGVCVSGRVLTVHCKIIIVIREIDLNYMSNNRGDSKKGGRLPPDNKRPLSSPEEEGLSKKKIGVSDNPLNKATPDNEMAANVNITMTEGETGQNTGRDTTSTVFNEILDMIHTELKEIRSSNAQIQADVSLLRDEITHLKGTVKFLSDNFDSQQSKINNLEQENRELKRLIKDQSTNIEEMDQYSKRNNLIFDGILESDKENTEDIIISKCRKLGVEVMKEDIQVSHRLGAKLQHKPKPRPVIARFVSVGTVRSILTKGKQQFNKTNPVPTTEVVKVREHLTDHRHKLFTECLRLKREQRIHTCWIYNFAVYVKKRPSDTRGTRVNDHESLMSLLKN